jgi:hypothetical protein
VLPAVVVTSISKVLCKFEGNLIIGSGIVICEKLGVVPVRVKLLPLGAIVAS